MTFFYALVLILLAGGGAIALILITEKKKESPQPEQKKTTEPQLSPKELLTRLGLENPKLNETKVVLPEMFKKSVPNIAVPLPAVQSTSSSKNVPLSASAQAESELSLKYDELLANNKELQAQYAKLETLFAEKSLNLEKSEKTLSNELKNQKEFNKVKDLLEKEIKDAKDRINTLQGTVSSSQTEAQTHLKRVSQLEEKVKKLEMEILTSESAINDAQALTQLARKHSAELEEKLRNSENQILEKNQKINDLVLRLKDLPNIAVAKDHANPLPNHETPAVISPPLPTVNNTNVVEQGGGQEKLNPSPIVLEPLGESAAVPTAKEEKPAEQQPPIDEKSTLKNIEAPKIVPLLDKQRSKNKIIEKPADGALTLAPDIFANPSIPPPEPKEDPPKLSP